MNLPAKTASGKITLKDEKLAVILQWIPWISVPLVSLPVPLVFLVLFLASNTTESAAIYFLVGLISLGVGAAFGILIAVYLLLWKRRWLANLRDRLAADGITATEVRWFNSELSSAERESLSELGKNNPLLADAYCETLASRLTASRLIARAKSELRKLDRRKNRAQEIVGANTTLLFGELESDRRQLEQLLNEATSRLAEARMRLQNIEAAASRNLNQTETESMLRRLSSAQDYLPLAIEIANQEHEARQDKLRQSDPASKSPKN